MRAIYLSPVHYPTDAHRKLAAGDCIALHAQDQHHLQQVLRLKHNSQLRLMSPAHPGLWFNAQWRPKELEVISEQAQAQTHHCHGQGLHLLCAYPGKKEAEEMFVQALELGLGALTFWASQYAETPKLSATPAQWLQSERWQLLEKNAREQSNNSHPLELSWCSDLNQLATLSPTRSERVLIFHLAASDHSAAAHESQDNSVLAVMGPAGGLSPLDLDQLMAAFPGAQLSTLPCPILRATTAFPAIAGFLLARSAAS